MEILTGEDYSWTYCKFCNNSRYILGSCGTHDCDCVKENQLRIEELEKRLKNEKINA